MNNLINILTLNEKQICRLLENHTLFEYDEIKLAAKIKVKNDKRRQFGYFGQMQTLINQAQDAEARYMHHELYNKGFSQAQGLQGQFGVFPY